MCGNFEKYWGEKAAPMKVLSSSWCDRSVVILAFRSSLADPEREGWCGVTVVPGMTKQRLDSNITLAIWLFLREWKIVLDKGGIDLF